MINQPDNLPGWLTYSGWFTHISGHPSATGRAQDSESSPAKDRRSTTVPHNHPKEGGAFVCKYLTECEWLLVLLIDTRCWPVLMCGHGEYSGSQSSTSTTKSSATSSSQSRMESLPSW